MKSIFLLACVLLFLLALSHPTTIDDLERELLLEKIQLLKTKLALLEQLKEDSPEMISHNDDEETIKAMELFSDQDERAIAFEEEQVREIYEVRRQKVLVE